MPRRHPQRSWERPLVDSISSTVSFEYIFVFFPLEYSEVLVYPQEGAALVESFVLQKLVFGEDYLTVNTGAFLTCIVNGTCVLRVNVNFMLLMALRAVIQEKTACDVQLLRCRDKDCATNMPGRVTLKLCV